MEHDNAKQIWKDFSSGKGGNVVAFLMEHDQLSYPEAIKYLAKKYNIDIIYSNEKIYENREPHYEKVPLLLKNIVNYDYLIWIDSDAFFYNDSDNILNYYTPEKIFFK